MQKRFYPSSALNRKSMDTTVSFVKTVRSHEITFADGGLKDKQGTLSLDGRALKLKFLLTRDESMHYLKKERMDDFLFTLEGHNYKVEKASNFLNVSWNHVDADDDATVVISEVWDERFCKGQPYYYRYILPAKGISWIHHIYTGTYQVGTMCIGGLINLHFDEGDVQVYPFSCDNIKYMVVESMFPCAKEVMDGYLYSISLAMGLVTSVIPFDYTCVVASSTGEFEDDALCGFREMRPTIKGQYNIFTTNMYLLEEGLKRNNMAYALQQLYTEEGKLNIGLQDWMQPEDFNRLVKMLYDNESLARAALLLVESSTLSLDMQGAVCSVMLETIRGVVEKQHTAKFSPIPHWEKEVKPEFLELISRMCDDGKVTEEQKKHLENKLNALCQPSNRDALSLPFRVVGYELSKEELKVISDRNVFLHGNILGNGYEQSYNEVLYACMELQKLCAVLLFRLAGFRGLLVNNAVLHGCEKARKAQEPVLV